MSNKIDLITPFDTAPGHNVALTIFLSTSNISGMQRVVSSTTKKEGLWRCDPCRWYYYPDKGDPTQNIPPGTSFEDLPNTWRCPICKEPKSMFTLVR